MCNIYNTHTLNEKQNTKCDYYQGFFSTPVNLKKDLNFKIVQIFLEVMPNKKFARNQSNLNNIYYNILSENTIQLFIDCSKIKRQRWNIGSGAERGNHNNQVSGVWLSW